LYHRAFFIAVSHHFCIIFLLFVYLFIVSSCIIAVSRHYFIISHFFVHVIILLCLHHCCIAPFVHFFWILRSLIGTIMPASLLYRAILISHFYCSLIYLYYRGCIIAVLRHYLNIFALFVHLSISLCHSHCFSPYRAYESLLHIYRSLLHTCRSLLPVCPFVYRSLFVYESLVCLFTGLFSYMNLSFDSGHTCLQVSFFLSCLYRSLLPIYMSLLHKYRSLLHTCRSLLPVCPLVYRPPF